MKAHAQKLAIQFSISGMLVIALTGCGSLFNTAKHSTFACQGDNCPTPLEVYNETNSAPPEIAVGRNPKSWGVKGEGKRNQGDALADDYLERSLLLAKPDQLSVGSHESSLKVKPIRTQSQVMRIWIAPWIDDDDNLHWNGYVYTEVSPRTWEIGVPEVRNAGVLQQVRNLQ